MAHNGIYHSTITAPVIDDALARNDLRWIPQNTVLVELSAYLAGRGHRLMWDRTLRRLTTTPIPPAEPT
jgi:hypothetical protein